MLFKLSLLSSLFILAAANPVPSFLSGGSAPPSGRCNTGPIQCCSSVQTASSPGVGGLLGLLGVVLGANVPIGLTCTPITVGLGGNSCSGRPVCCENNNFSGLIAIGCTPIEL